jgi:hypothetical protein
VGDAYDNAMCESFFATLECELRAAAAPQCGPGRKNGSAGGRTKECFYMRGG